MSPHPTQTALQSVTAPRLYLVTLVDPTNQTAGSNSCLIYLTGMSPVTRTMPSGLTLLLKPFSRPCSPVSYCKTKCYLLVPFKTGQFTQLLQRLLQGSNSSTLRRGQVIAALILCPNTSFFKTAKRTQNSVWFRLESMQLVSSSSLAKYTELSVSKGLLLYRRNLHFYQFPWLRCYQYQALYSY